MTQFQCLCTDQKLGMGLHSFMLQDQCLVWPLSSDAPPFEVVDIDFEMLKLHQLISIALLGLLVQSTFETSPVEGWQVCPGFLALPQSSMWYRVPLFVVHLMCLLCTCLARKDRLLWPRGFFVGTSLGNFLTILSQ